MTFFLRTLLIPVLLIGILSGGCSSGIKVSKNKIPMIEQNGKTSPSFRFYHADAENSRLYYRIPVKNIVFKRNPQTQLFDCRVKIECQIYRFSDLGKPVATPSQTEELSLEMIPEEAIEGVMDIPLKEPEGYFALISITDLTSARQVSVFRKVGKNRPGPGWFLPTDGQGSILADNFVHPADTVRFSIPEENDEIFITRFHPEGSYPNPAYIPDLKNKIILKKDTTFTLGTDNEWIVPDKGIYLVRRDTSLLEGLTLLSDYPGYPWITRKSALAPMLRYITSDQEFKDILYAANSKAAAEDFWMKTGGGIAAAEKLLRIYYSRAQYANQNFTTIREGWRTDKGMIHMLYGEPSRIVVAPESERWIYGKEDASYAVEFTFFSAGNRVAPDDMVLDRNSQLKEIWETAVRYWREGIPFNNMEIIKIQDEYEYRRSSNNHNNIWY